MFCVITLEITYTLMHFWTSHFFNLYAIRNLEKLSPSTPSTVRKVAERKMRETVQQKQSIMSIMPGLAAQQRNQKLLPAVPTHSKDSVNINKLPLAKSVQERKRENFTPAVTYHMKTSNDVTKVGTATSTILRSKVIPNNKSISQRPVNGAPLQATVSVPLSGNSRKYEGAPKTAVSRPNSFSSGRGERASNNSSTSIRTEPAGCASSELRTSQNGLARVPLKDRSNNATKAVRK